jgi:hypothetical protein
LSDGIVIRYLRQPPLRPRCVRCARADTRTRRHARERAREAAGRGGAAVREERGQVQIHRIVRVEEDNSETSRALHSTQSYSVVIKRHSVLLSVLPSPPALAQRRLSQS